MEEDIKKIKDEYVHLTMGVIDYDKFNNFLITHHSTAIEGSTLSYQEIILLLENGITPGNGKPFEQLLMAKDHLEALKYTLKIAEDKTKLSVDIVQNISAMILKNTGAHYNLKGGTFDSSKGEFRKGSVHVGTRSFANYTKVPGLVNELVDYINANIDKKHDFIENSILAFDAHFQMVSIHPFADGNGRLSRLIMNYIQHYGGQPVTPVLSEDKKLYFEALEETRNKQDPDIFRKFMFGQSLKYFKAEIQTLTKEQDLKRDNGKGLSFLF